MKLLARFIATPLLVFACAPLCHAQSAATQPRQDAPPSPPALTLSAWKEFAPAGGGFSILFPGTPQSTTQTLRLSPTHSAELHIHSLTNPTLECSVIYADYPIPVGDPAVARRVLDSGARGAVASVNAELLSLTEITHEGHPGRLLRERMPDGKILRAKMVLVGQRLYQIAFTTPRPEGAPAETVRHYEETAAKFIDSFKLTPAKPTSASGPSGPTGTPQDAPAEAAGPGEVDQYLADHPGEVYGRLREGEIERLGAAGAPVSTSSVAEGETVSKPTPAYPAVAKAARASGAVVVMVVVDEGARSSRRRPRAATRCCAPRRSRPPARRASRRRSLTASPSKCPARSPTTSTCKNSD